MKLALAFLLLAAPARAASTGSGINPVSRVVQLLKGVSEKVEKEHKEEEELFETFECWAKSVIEAKTKSNEKAKSRKESLETYVDDLENGRIELTTERVDLEKEIAGLTSDIDTAEALRKKEKDDYAAAVEELEKVVGALKDAIEVLEEATKGEGEKSASLLGFGSRLNSGSLEARAERGEALGRAVELGRRFLSPGDAAFLQRLLTGDVPKADWKKLNRKADFKMKYEARSGKIQKLLTGMLKQFEDSLEETKTTEEEAGKSHGKLMESKKEQLDTAKDALKDMSKEGGARDLSKSEAKDEIKDLEEQIKNDKKYIEETEEALEEKTEEWKDRQKVRSDELEAISKAISILYSDDARDLFKRSMSSRGYMLLQMRAGVAEAKRASEQRRGAAASLKKVARSTGDSRLTALAAQLAHEVPEHFKKVVEEIDGMVELLEEEEEEDLKTKEDCEDARAKDTRSAAKTSREIDELSDEVTRLEEEIEELNTEIEEKQEEIVTIETELNESKKIRESEKEEWEKTDADDEEAAKLVGDATEVMKDFYSEAKKSFLQAKPPKLTDAGEAPPPPPSTWKEPYKGAQPENEGIVSILEMIKESIEKDQEKAKKDEDEAQKEFEKLEKKSEKQIEDLEKSISDLNGTISEKAGKVEENKEDRLGKKEELDDLIEKLKEASPDCDFFTVNYALRSKNRKMEIKGLKNAKSMLSGGPPDAAGSFVQEPNRSSSNAVIKQSRPHQS